MQNFKRAKHSKRYFANNLRNAIISAPKPCKFDPFKILITAYRHSCLNIKSHRLRNQVLLYRDKGLDIILV